MSRRRNDNDLRDDSSDDEAKQVDQGIEESQERQLQEQQRDADDLQQNQSGDYQQIAQLDQYQQQGIDDQSVQYDQQARRRAQIQLNRMNVDQDRMDQDQLDQYMQDQRQYQLRLNQQYNEMNYDQQNQQGDQLDDRRFIDYQEVKGHIKNWINDQQTKKYIKNKFGNFLTRFKGNQNYAIYAQKLRKMAINNKQSFQISFQQISKALPTISKWIGFYPNYLLPILNKIAYAVVVKNFPTYKTFFFECFVKIIHLPYLDHIRDLKYDLVNKLVHVKGVITIRSQVFNQMKQVIYKCYKCGHLKQPIQINQKNQIKLGNCKSCHSTGPFSIQKSKTVYRNYQKMTIQQSPSDVLPGRIPRSKQIIVFGDNVDLARPGDQVQIVGTFMHKYDCMMNIKQGFPLFSTFIQVNHIVKISDVQSMSNDMYQQQLFRKYANDPNIAKKIYASIAPSIYGHQFVKMGLTLAMFGGQPVQGTHRVRGDINVLLLGDPGIAKSQFLKSIQKVFHRCIYTTGKGASAVGLTASVKRDFQTNQWKLQAGALVLADKGICLIDQFDKMNQHDRTSIHEAMEQQSISISKAGIVTSLRARCSVIAAANPVQGRYNSSHSFADNVDLSDPILSRFDILNVIKDQVKPQIDYKLATFVINSHISNHPYNQKYQIQQQKLQLLKDQQQGRTYIDHKQLKQYIKYARQKCHPQLSQKNQQLVRNFFAQLRQASKNYGGMHVSIRQIQSIIRISKAHAKIHLRTQVQKKDIDVGIYMLMQSFIQTQKASTANDLRKKFSKYLSL